MAIGVLRQPDKWSSAYRPTEFVVNSDKYLNGTPGETGIPIFAIAQGTAGVFVTTTQFTTFDLQVGEMVNVGVTNLGLYSGNFRVRSIEDFGFYIAVYIDTAYVGDDSGGQISRVYDDFKILATITFPEWPRTVDVELAPDENYQFTLNVQDICARQFTRVFDVLRPNLGFTTIENGDKTIATEYQVTFQERYTGWTNGVPATVTDKASGIVFRGLRTVNAVHPYHKSDQFTMDWDSDMSTIFPMGNGTGQKKFLSWASRTEQVVNPGDDFFISFLMNTVNESAWQVVVTPIYNGVPFGIQAFLPPTYPKYAGTVNVGPANLSVLSGADSYSVRILANGVDIMEPLTLIYKCDTSEVARRVYWRNKLGGVDQFTMRGREMEIPTVSRESVSRISNPVPLNSKYIGGWNERGTRVEVSRSKMLTSDHVKVSTMRWLSEDCFESHDIATEVRSGWWTPMVVESAGGQDYGTNNENQRFALQYHFGIDNLSQRG